MTILTEVSVSPAEPLRDRAAKLAFKLDKLCSVCLALRRADTQFISSTLAAHQVLRFEILLLLLCANAVFHAAEIRLVAGEAKVVSTLENSVFA